MKKQMVFLTIVVSVVTFLFSTGAFAQGLELPSMDKPISPRYQITDTVKVSLSITSGTASCRGSVKATDSSSNCSVTIVLLQKVNGMWRRVGGWSNSGQSGTFGVTAKGSCSVRAGIYKLSLSGSVTDSNGKTERVRKVSSEKIVP